ncbi:hypothetical protein [Sphingomonas sp. BK580]|uniref:hypothetical protein n=1 Tax=Sphingomonas sp. BK580 TaxID=2586972 RepID=UPI00161C2948|nr:hypothetical protein [Sphingomonas sp. BK580]MBB3692452.1 hypothetical protein [Sphingomonas sp. BK580]
MADDQHPSEDGHHPDLEEIRWKVAEKSPDIPTSSNECFWGGEWYPHMSYAEVRGRRMLCLKGKWVDGDISLGEDAQPED